MYQKDLIRSAWKSAGLYDENDSKLQQFLKMLDDPTQCWNELTDACRRSYAAYKAKLVQPIMGTSDKLVHLNVIRTTIESNDDEMGLLEQYIASSDPVRDQVELKAIALKNVPRLNEALNKKPNLTQDVRGALATQAATAITPKAPAAATPPTAPVTPTAPMAGSAATTKPTTPTAQTAPPAPSATVPVTPIASTPPQAPTHQGQP
jgi:hypothetical protein